MESEENSDSIEQGIRDKTDCLDLLYEKLHDYLLETGNYPDLITFKMVSIV